MGTLSHAGVFAAVVALGTVEVLASSADMAARESLLVQAAAPATPGLGDQRHIEGRVARVDQAGGTLLLEDGTTLTVPESLMLDRHPLETGARIEARYEERAGRKVVTALTVHPPR